MAKEPKELEDLTEKPKRKKFTGNKFKYTESELKDRGCGTPIDTRDQKWSLKKATYTNEGVWNDFTSLRDSFRALFTDADKYVNTEVSNRDAQRIMDVFLVRRSRGQDVYAPKAVVPVNAVPDGVVDGGISLVDRSEFSDEADGISFNDKVSWAFEHIGIDGLKPSDAPSPGTWRYMQELRNDDMQLKDFYRTTLPKLFSKSNSLQSSKLADDGKETIELIERLIEALPVKNKRKSIK